MDPGTADRPGTWMPWTPSWCTKRETHERCDCHVCNTLRTLLAANVEAEHDRRSPTPLLLTFKQAGALLGVSEATVRELGGDQELRAVTIQSYGRQRIPRAEIDDYVSRLLTGQLRAWVEARRDVEQWGLRYMGDRRDLGSLSLIDLPTESDIRLHMGRLSRLEQEPEEMIGAAKELVEAAVEHVLLELDGAVPENQVAVGSVLIRSVAPHARPSHVGAGSVAGLRGESVAAPATPAHPPSPPSSGSDAHASGPSG